MNWDQIEGFEGWSSALEALIVALARAFSEKNESGKNTALQNLRDFIKFSPNDIAGPLDDIALRTVMGAVAKDWNEGVAELAERSAELAKLTKQINTITRANARAADDIRMTRIRAVIDESTSMLKAFSDLKMQLASDGDADAEAIVAKVDAAVRAVQTLRNSIERI